MYPEARIDGHVTRDPSLKLTKTGKSVCEFSVAVNQYSKSGGESTVSYFDIETWEKLAEKCSNNINKGKRVMVIGNLKQDRWEDDDGKTKSKIKIVGKNVEFLEPLRNIKKSSEPVIAA